MLCQIINEGFDRVCADFNCESAFSGVEAGRGSAIFSGGTSGCEIFAYRGRVSGSASI